MNKDEILKRVWELFDEDEEESMTPQNITSNIKYSTNIRFQIIKLLEEELK